jgi:hypothetical protein
MKRLFGITGICWILYFIIHGIIFSRLGLNPFCPSMENGHFYLVDKGISKNTYIMSQLSVLVLGVLTALFWILSWFIENKRLSKKNKWALGIVVIGFIVFSIFIILTSLGALIEVFSL